METDHIKPKAEGGTDEIENAIPVCFECHAEIHAYNDKHPKGRKFTPEEIKGHKEQWLKICETRAEIFTEPSKYEVGPITALMDELEFNLTASTQFNGLFICAFRDEQFRRAINSGAISVLSNEVKEPILLAYVQIGKANQAIAKYTNTTNLNENPFLFDQIKAEIKPTQEKITQAKNSLNEFLKSEN